MQMFISLWDSSQQSTLQNIKTWQCSSQSDRCCSQVDNQEWREIHILIGSEQNLMQLWMSSPLGGLALHLTLSSRAGPLLTVEQWLISSSPNTTSGKTTLNIFNSHEHANAGHTCAGSTEAIFDSCSTIFNVSKGPNKTFTSSGEANSYHSLVGVRHYWTMINGHDENDGSFVYLSLHVYSHLEKQTLLSVQTHHNRNVLRGQWDKISPKKTICIESKMFGRNKQKAILF